MCYGCYVFWVSAKFTGKCPLTFAVWKFQNLHSTYQTVCVLLFALALAKEGKKRGCHEGNKIQL